MTEKKKGLGLAVVKENLENLSICLLFKVTLPKLYCFLRQGSIYSFPRSWLSKNLMKSLGSRDLMPT